MEDKILIRIAKAQAIILKLLGKTFKEIKDIAPSQLHIIKQQLVYGGRLDEIIKELSEALNITIEETQALLEAQAQKDYKFAKVYYEAKNQEYVPLKENIALKTMLDTIKGSAAMDELYILTTAGLTYLDIDGNKVTKPIKEAFKDIIDKAVLTIQMGAGTYEREVQKQLKTLAKAGIRRIEYASGNTRRIDSALRMTISDQLNELANSQQRILGEQYGADGIEISVHEYPAPDHEDIQGYQFDKTNHEKVFNNQDAETYQGKVIYAKERRHIGWYNCKHLEYQIVLGINQPRYTETELKAIIKRNKDGFKYNGRKYTMYEGTQLQRRLETQIRQVRDQISATEGYGEPDPELENQLQACLNEYKKVCSIANLPINYDRIRSY